MNQLTQEDLKNILVLINNTPIKGSDSGVVAMLVQKISSMLISQDIGKEVKEK